MKVFILLAIIFFSWRVFSEDGYYYEGRYYKIDEYIRFQEDPGYQAFVNEKRAEARTQRVGVEEYFAEMEKAKAQQERTRLQHLAEMDTQPAEKDLSKLEAEYEKEKLAETKLNEKYQQMYLARRDAEVIKSRPTRMVASVFESDEDQPLKRVPREKRKYIPKVKSPIEQAKAKKNHF